MIVEPPPIEQSVSVLAFVTTVMLPVGEHTAGRFAMDDVLVTILWANEGTATSSVKKNSESQRLTYCSCAVTPRMRTSATSSVVAVSSIVACQNKVSPAAQLPFGVIAAVSPCSMLYW